MSEPIKMVYEFKSQKVPKEKKKNFPILRDQKATLQHSLFKNLFAADYEVKQLSKSRVPPYLPLKYVQ